MASIVQKKNRYYVVYLYDSEDGRRKQKWESFKTKEEAKRRKAEIEYRQELGSLVIPKCKTVEELLREYVSLYGKNTWSMSMYEGSTGLIKNYINPIIGPMKLSEVTPRVLEKYYMSLLQTKAVIRCTDKQYTKRQTPGKRDSFVTPGTVRRVHKLLNSAFTQAMKWELIEKNPAQLATVPKVEKKTRDIWDADTLFHALEVCEDERLKLAINLAFSCSLRIGELLGLTWDCVDISEESLAEGKASIFINKELQRVRKSTMETLEKKDVLCVFPEHTSGTATVLVLKKPKTLTSTRRIYLPRTVAEMLIGWKRDQEMTKEELGSEYHDYQLVIAGPFGAPMEHGRINELFNQLIEQNNLPKVVFHSLRHSSITYKLKLNGGDVKSVQGDSGHAQAKMVTDQYSHILDEDRKNNAQIFEDVFYQKKTPGQIAAEQAGQSAGIDAELLMKVLTNPEMAKLLKALAETIE